MKKFFIIFFLFLFIPSVYASCDLYQDVYIESDGDLLIKQVLNLDGTFNGFELNFDYTYFGEDAIYGADNIEINKVCEIDPQSFEAKVYNPVNCFAKVNSASKGDSKKYTFSSNRLMMYNPSNVMKNKAFYIEYTLKNTIVQYNDVADLKLSILDSGFTEDISSYKLRLNLPDKDSNFRIWGHGPLYGEVDRLDDSTGFAIIDDVPSGTELYIRMIFNKDLIPLSTKKVDKTMFDEIIRVETLSADDANKEREEARDIISEEQAKSVRNYFIFALIPWLAGIIGIFSYERKQKKNDTNFQQQYFRDFPDNSSPESVQQLVNKNLDSTGLSASLLNIIRKKALTIQEFNTTSGLLKKESKDYKITINDTNIKEPLTNEELYLRSWFLATYGDGISFDLSSLNKKLKKESDARDFMTKYNEWLRMCKDVFNSYNYYEDISGILVLFGLISAIPLIGSLLFFPATMPISLFLLIGSIIYIMSIKKRTAVGKEKYFMWLALKNFMNDFGRMDEKELPEIYLWEKYLVFATVFGIAEKVRKQMEVKIKNFQPEYYDSNRDFLDTMILNNVINNTIGSSVTKAYSTAQSTISRVASSRDSSGGGTGGGFSSGGSFGGGGGMSGGRF